MRRSLIASLVFAVLVALAFPISAIGKPAEERSQRGRGGSDIVRMPADVHAKINTQGAVESKTAKTAAQVGQVRTWLGLDDVAGGFYTKGYKLRGIGEHIEVWSATGTKRVNGVQASNLNFQGGDCRNGVRTTVTDAQVAYYIDQFDNNMQFVSCATF